MCCVFSSLRPNKIIVWCIKILVQNIFDFSVYYVLSCNWYSRINFIKGNLVLLRGDNTITIFVLTKSLRIDKNIVSLITVELCIKCL